MVEEIDSRYEATEPVLSRENVEREPDEWVTGDVYDVDSNRYPNVTELVVLEDKPVDRTTIHVAEYDKKFGRFCAYQSPMKTLEEERDSGVLELTTKVRDMQEIRQEINRP